MFGTIKNLNRRISCPTVGFGLKGLWDKPAQELMAEMYMRPSDEQVLAAHKDTLPDIETFEPVAVFGPWAEIMDTFFVDGGRFDQLARTK